MTKLKRNEAQTITRIVLDAYFSICSSIDGFSEFIYDKHWWS